MNWVRLYIVVEGQSEREFVGQTLTPHLANRSIEVKPRVVQTNRKLDKRGGLNDFETLRRDLDRLLRQDAAREARFTTMIDLYGLPPTFPGRELADKQTARADKVAILEAAFQAAIADDRFSPHVQVHEFETLLYCDLNELRSRIEDSSAGLQALEKEVHGMAPEDINERPTHAPSKRLIRHVPAYAKQKVRVGAPAAAAIGLPTLREKCPHFDAWVTTLERLGSDPLSE